MPEILEHDRTKVRLKWNKNTEPDFSHYILKVGDENSTWETATIIADNYDLNTEYIYTLPSSGTYKFFIKAVNKSGIESLYPASTPASYYQIEPNTPTAGNNPITQDINDKRKLIVKWNPSPHLDFKHYEVCYMSWDENNKIITSENTLIYTLPENTLITNHTFLIKEVNRAGKKSEILTLQGTFTLNPSNVGAITVTQDSNDKQIFNLSWNHIPDGDFAYYILKTGNSWSSPDFISPQFTNPSYQMRIMLEKTTKIMIKAVNKWRKESVIESVVNIDTSSTYSLRPSTPTNQRAVWSKNARDKVVVSWTGIADKDLECYQIKPLGVSWNDPSVKETKENSVIFTITNSGVHSFVIRAKNKGGYYSNEIVAVSNSVKLEPSDVNVDSITFIRNNADKSQYTIKWDAISDLDFDRYEIYYESPLNGISKTLLYNDLRNSSFTFVVSNQNPYIFYIKAYNKLNKSSSEVSKALTPDLSPSNITGLTTIYDIAKYGRDTIIVKWNKHPDLDFEIFEVKLSTEEWEDAVQTKENSAMFKMNNSGSYTFNIRAKNKAGYYSSVASVTSPVITLEPSNITNVNITQRTNDKRNFILTWNAVSDIDIKAYIIKYENITQNSGIIDLATVTDTKYDLFLTTQD